MTRLKKIRQYFLAGLWSEKRVKDAVAKGAITQKEAEALLKEKENANGHQTA